MFGIAVLVPVSFSKNTRAGLVDEASAGFVFKILVTTTESVTAADNAVSEKVPAVIETPHGDFIGIRHKMFLSHSYDHRVVDGSLGGQFVKRVADYLEQFDPKREL